MSNNSKASTTAKKKITIMYLKVRQVCPLDTLFDLPHKDMPYTAKKIAMRYPKFAKIFDGVSEENTLCFYYKKNKERDVYEFIDIDAEEEVADLLGVKIVESMAVNDDEPVSTTKLTAEQLDEFKSHMQDIKTGISWLKNQHNSDSSNSDSSNSDSSDSDSSDSDSSLDD